MEKGSIWPGKLALHHWYEKGFVIRLVEVARRARKGLLIFWFCVERSADKVFRVRDSVHASGYFDWYMGAESTGRGLC